jgi:hypothetical protein
MHNFKELKIWQRSKDLVKEIYSFTSKFPHKERYVLVSQINRCVISISSNIAEGAGRSGNKDFQRFLDIANDLGYLSNDILSLLTLKVQEIQKMIRGFRHHIEKSNV